MPRKSAAELAVGTRIESRTNRLRPPSALSEPERTIFNETVNACDPLHFARSDLPLLCRWAEQNYLAEQAAYHLRKGALVDGRPSPWITIQEKVNRAIVALALRLRLSPQARQPNNPIRVGAGRQGRASRPGTASAYDLMDSEP
jgi:hypothetical protein